MSGTQELVDAQEQGGARHQHEGKQEVGAADHHELTRHDRVRDRVDDENDGDIKTRAQREIRQKRQPGEQPAGVAPQHEPIEREQRGANRAADDRAGAGRSVVKVAVKRADQNAGKDDPEEAAQRGGVQHRRRL